MAKKKSTAPAPKAPPGIDLPIMGDQEALALCLMEANVKAKKFESMCAQLHQQNQTLLAELAKLKKVDNPPEV